MNDRAIPKDLYLEHTALKPHIKVTVEIGCHRMDPEVFPPIHIPPE